MKSLWAILPFLVSLPQQLEAQPNPTTETLQPVTGQTLPVLDRAVLTADARTFTQNEIPVLLTIWNSVVSTALRVDLKTDWITFSGVSIEHSATLAENQTRWPKDVATLTTIALALNEIRLIRLYDPTPTTLKQWSEKFSPDTWESLPSHARAYAQALTQTSLEKHIHTILRAAGYVAANPNFSQRIRPLFWYWHTGKPTDPPLFSEEPKP